MERAPSIEITADGSATLRSAIFVGADGRGDTYHSVRGAAGEARHVFIENGFLQAVGGDGDTRCEPVRILEMGFGTGLNAWLTLLEAARSGWRVEYAAVELYPVPEKVAAALGYSSDPRFMAMHRVPWGEWTEPAEGFRLLKLNSDLAKTEFSDTFDLVYYDAFAPDTQPELWTTETFGRIAATMADCGTLVTYSVKGDVRRALQAAGFAVERLPGALGKRHMLRARKVKN